MLGLLFFILALGVIVLVHELGHLLVAKYNNIYCHEFSIGMGPRIVKFYTDKSGTEYSIRAIPIGGFVLIAGEDIDKEIDVDVPKENKLDNKSPLVKLAVLVAGSTFNFIFTFLILCGLSFFNGIAVDEAYVNINNGNVNLNNVMVSKIDGTDVVDRDDLFSKLEEVKTNSNEVVIVYNEENVEKEVVLVKDKDGLLGISATINKYDFFGSIKNGFIQLIELFKELFRTIYVLITEPKMVSNLAGPIGIYEMSSSFVDKEISSKLSWIAFLSINIGFMNLLPIPVLDGGRMVLVFFEMIFRRKISKKVENILLTTGLVILLSLFAISSFNDIIRLFN